MASGSRSFNFGSDDVLCSYDDFSAPDSSSAGAKRPDLAAKDFPDGRMARPLVNIYEQEDHSKEDLVSTVEKCMKKYADTLMRSLDGITGRLSQLEIHCYKLERSIGELRGDMVQGQNEADLKFKSLEKHMHEVHRAVQILRDKQELAETQKELAKLQTIQKESPPKPDERTSSPHPEPAKHDDAPQLSNNQLALVPSRPQAVQPQQQQHLALPQPQLSQLPVQQDQYTVSQPTTFFSVSQAQAQQLPPGYHFVQVTPAQPPQAPVQPPQQQAAPPAQQVTPPQVVNAMPQQPAPQFPQQWAPQQPNLNPNQQQFTSQGMPPSQAALPSQPVPPQQWAHQQPNLNPNQQQFTSQGMPLSQAAPPSQSVPPSAAPQRPHPPAGYSPYPPHQPSNPITETYAVSMPIPASYSAAPQPGMNRSDMAPVGYGNQGNARQPIPSQGSFMAAPQMGKGGYTNGPPYMQGNLPGYNSGPYNYPPSNAPGAPMGPQQLPRNHPYSEFVEKAVGMGYPREQVTNVALKMTENGQAMDFNALLDRLNGVSTPSPRAWSG